VSAMKEAQTQTLFGLPVVVTDAVAPGTALVGSFPPPERDNMTIQEYAEQCAKYWYKLRIEDEARNN